jgi:thiamine-monophosphate kinase
MSLAMGSVGENRLLSRWWQTLSRHPAQANLLHETDCELLPIEGTDDLLALTIDTVAEEVALGFYREPETIGWMGATVSLSDLAATGATPIGLLASVTLPRAADASYQDGVARGLEAACRAAGTHVLGGDTNFAEQAAIATVAVGRVPRDRVLRRVGCSAGDLLYATGPLGAGGSCAARALLPIPAEVFCERDYRPRARIAEARLLSGFASACMDTSDGLVATLDQLGRLNGVGFVIERPLLEILEERSRRLAALFDLDPLLFFAQHHGEFELVFTVPAARREGFEEHARQAGLSPLFLGRALPEAILRFAGPPPREVDGARIRNLLEEVGGDLGRYLVELGQIVSG